MDILSNIALGLGVAFRPENLLFCTLGVVIGTLIGVIPGIGPVGAMGLLLPATMYVSPEASIIMLAGIYYGAQYGGTITSVLVRIPGEATSIITCIDGHELARKGRAGAALGIAAWGSFIAGTVSVLILMLVAQPLASMALRFGPPEYFAIICIGLVLVTHLSQGSTLKALMMAFVGFILGGVGLDLVTALPRFTLGINELSDGIGIVPVVMGLFGVAEVLENLEGRETKVRPTETRVKNLWPTMADWARAKWPIVRGTLIGFFIGILPGGGGVLATFTSYAIERRISKHPEEFGKGAIEGVAGPETANNAAASGGLVPLLSLGLPTGPIMAMLFAALVIQGVQPGPMFISNHPQIFWGLVMSMYVGNVLLLILNLPLIGVWVQILKTPGWMLYQLIFLFCLIGAYSVNNSTFDVLVMLVFGGVGYVMRKFHYDAGPLVLAFVLGPILEQNLRQSLLISRGDFSIFVTRPISGAILLLVLLILISNVLPYLRARRRARGQFRGAE
ncbi:tripartite tricarboxylate transporter permease [Chelativorans alearense]|uniref:tripartite tricarboxylate transporter permease n=1 Tax=Chelativorans alearense TaxID=2681495 RepID=UPI0013D4E577|nr:tripartite tricarboxylate transporter permease [Chelativorans alearense]